MRLLRGFLRSVSTYGLSRVSSNENPAGALEVAVTGFAAPLARRG
jgi:hypothetical protein